MPYNNKPGARKYGDKPESMSGFKMRSGNGPLQFKQMGSSSPAKQGISDWADVLGKKEDIQVEEMAKQTPKVETTKLTAKTDEVTPDKPRVATPKELRKKHKKEGDKVTLKERKEAGEGTVASRAIKGIGKGIKKAGSWFKDTQTKLIGEEGSEKRARHQAMINKAVNTLNRMNELNQQDLPTDQVQKYQQGKRSAEAHKMKMENFERDALQTDQLNELRADKIRLLRESEAGESEIQATKTATDDGITSNLEPAPVGNTVAAEYAKGRDSYTTPQDMLEESRTPATFNRKNRLKFGK